MRHALTFRYAATQDFEAVLELASQLAIYIEAATPSLTVADFHTFYLGSHAPMRLLLAIRESRVVGMISWTLTHELYSANTRAYISDLAVDCSVRGQGVGVALMSEVKTWARANNVSKLGWEVWHKNVVAKKFYERLGASIDEEAIPYVLKL